MSAVMVEQIHVWQAAGVGQAPFRVAGFFSLPSPALAEANPYAYSATLANAPRGYGLGQCAVCGQALVHNAMIHDASGRKFSVGLDCVKRAGDRGLITAAENARKQAARAERLRQQQERYEAYQAELEAQRQANGGLTNDEIAAQMREQAEAEKNTAISDALAPVLGALDRAAGSFSASMAEQIRAGRLPSGGAMVICCEIYAKHEAAKTGKGARSVDYKTTVEAAKNRARELFQAASELAAPREQS